MPGRSRHGRPPTNLPHCAPLRPRTVGGNGPIAAPRGTPVLRTNPLAARLLPRLLYQLVPAALVTTVGVLLLSNLAKAPDAPPAAAPVETAINAEAVFKIVPREPGADAEQDAKRAKAAPPRTAANPKPPRQHAASRARPRTSLRRARSRACRRRCRSCRSPSAAAGGRGTGQRQHGHEQAAKRHDGGPADSAMGRALGGGLVRGGYAAAPAAGAGAGAEFPGGDVAPQ